jgi:hypothetical protein
MLGAVNAANAAAVAAANPQRSIEFLLAPILDVSEPVSSTLPAGVATFSVANIMPTAVLAPFAKFAQPEALAADVSVTPAAAYSMLGVTTTARAEAVSADVTVATAASANLSTAEAAAADLTVPVDTAARAEAVPADGTVAIAASANLSTAEAAAAGLPVPVNSWQEQRQRPLMSLLQLWHLPIFLQQRQRPLISLSLLILRHCFLQEWQQQRQWPVMFISKNAASANLATAEAVVADLRGECVGFILHQFIYDMN